MEIQITGGDLLDQDMEVIVQAGNSNLISTLTTYYLGSINPVVIDMARRKIHRLGDLQLRIMQVLWGRGEATVGQVLAALGGDAERAYTTMATMLRKMETRGLVSHRVDGRSFLYRPEVAAQDVTRTMANHLVERLFEGSLIDAVSHLLTSREVSREELSELQRLIARKKREL